MVSTIYYFMQFCNETVMQFDSTVSLLESIKRENFCRIVCLLFCCILESSVTIVQLPVLLYFRVFLGHFYRCLG